MKKPINISDFKKEPDDYQLSSYEMSLIFGIAKTSVFRMSYDGKIPKADISKNEPRLCFGDKKPMPRKFWTLGSIRKLEPKKATGYVDYNVKTECPNCLQAIFLTQNPYLEHHAEDLLGLAVYGTPETPAKWTDFEIEYECGYCKKPFLLNNLEV